MWTGSARACQISKPYLHPIQNMSGNRTETADYIETSTKVARTESHYFKRRHNSEILSQHPQLPGEYSSGIPFKNVTYITHPYSFIRRNPRIPQVNQVIGLRPPTPFDPHYPEMSVRPSRQDEDYHCREQQQHNGG